MRAFWQNRYSGSLVGIAGAVILPFIVPTSELMWFFSAMLCIASIIALRSEERWHATIPAIFAWTLLAFNIRFADSFLNVLAVPLFYLAASIISGWQITPYVSNDHVRLLVLSQVIAVLLTEGFLTLLFWPINFPSRALFISILALIGYEVVAFRAAGKLSWRALLPSIALSGLVVAAVVRTADWYGL